MTKFGRTALVNICPHSRVNNENEFSIYFFSLSMERAEQEL